MLQHKTYNFNDLWVASRQTETSRKSPISLLNWLTHSRDALTGIPRVLRSTTKYRGNAYTVPSCVMNWTMYGRVQAKVLGAFVLQKVFGIPCSRSAPTGEGNGFPSRQPELQWQNTLPVAELGVGQMTTKRYRRRNSGKSQHRPDKWRDEEQKNERNGKIPEKPG